MQSPRAAIVTAALGLSVLELSTACTPQPKDVPTAKVEPAQRAQLVNASSGPVAEVVQAAQRTAAEDERTLIVYVGASWCEPCQVFIEGVASGGLPVSLGHLRILKFDSDADEGRLAEANYGGEMIPRFVKPGPEGLGSAARFEGSVRGPAALQNIVPRLEALIASP